jgi:hypothetical protein
MVPMCLLLGKSSLITGFVRFGVSSPSPITPFGESDMLEVLELWTEREVIFRKRNQLQVL